MPYVKSVHVLVPALVAGLFVVSACGGGGGGDGGNNGGGGNPPPPTTFDPVFSEIQANVFTPNCATSGCHQGGGAPQGLRLEEANSYGLLVDTPSSQQPTIDRVEPGDPDNSYLIQKLEGTAATGQQMPLNAAALSQTTINTIRQWITDGALDDRMPSPDPIRVVALTPDPGSDLTTAPTSIVASFDRELNTTSVDLNTFLLEASGGDGTFGDGNEASITAASITTSGSPPMTATFDLSGVALADDTYRVRLLGDGGTVVQDIDGNALDGEFSGSFPSGDGTAGGDFDATFTLTTATSGATLDDIQAAVFTPSCSGCHSGPTSGSLPAGMNLSNADASFAALVGVSSIQEPAIQRVAAGDPDNSYLIQKLEGTASTGSRMPQGGPFLDQATMDDIRQWISDGANR